MLNFPSIAAKTSKPLIDRVIYTEDLRSWGGRGGRGSETFPDTLQGPVSIFWNPLFFNRMSIGGNHIFKVPPWKLIKIEFLLLVQHFIFVFKYFGGQVSWRDFGEMGPSHVVKG